MLDYWRNLRKSSEEKQQEALNAYLDDALTPQQRGQIEKDLATDPALQGQLDQMRALKQQMRQLPRRQVPRNFTLDPALYGRPARESLLRAYPVLRTATALTAFIFIFALAANVFLSGAFSQAAGSAEPLAMMAEPASDMAVEEAAPEMEMAITEEIVEEEAAASDFAMTADEAIAGEMTLPSEAQDAPTFKSEEAALAPQATMEFDDTLQEASPQSADAAEAAVEQPTLAAAAPKVMATEIARQMLPEGEAVSTTQIQEQEMSRETNAPGIALDRAFLNAGLLLPALGLVLLILLVLTLLARRRL